MSICLYYHYDPTTLLLLDLQIPSDGFQAVSSVQVLDLSGNAASLQEHPLFSSIPHLQELYLRSVSWKLLYNFTHWCTKTNILFYGFMSAVCLWTSMLFVHNGILSIAWAICLTFNLAWQKNAATWSAVRYIYLTAIANPWFRSKFSSINSSGNVYLFELNIRI